VEAAVLVVPHSCGDIHLVLRTSPIMARMTVVANVGRARHLWPWDWVMIVTRVRMARNIWSRDWVMARPHKLQLFQNDQMINHHGMGLRDRWPCAANDPKEPGH